MAEGGADAHLDRWLGLMLVDADRQEPDGTVPDEFLKLRQNSENKDLDDASLRAIRKAAPFSHLPKDYSQPFIELRMSFYYNVDPPKPVPPVAITILRSSAKS